MSSALENAKFIENEELKTKCLKIRASVENIVHALLRVGTMSSRLPEIFNPPLAEDTQNENGSMDEDLIPEIGNNLRFKN